MELKEDVMKNKANNKMNELRIQAIINILSKEGILTVDEVDAELDNLIKKSEEEE